MDDYTLLSGKDPDVRLQILTDLSERAEKRIIHSDTFRQRNMNFALIIFAGFIALGARIEGQVAHMLISGTLFVLMVIFILWDRRWHRTKHGWYETLSNLKEKIIQLANDPTVNIDFKLYYPQGEKAAELLSFQPMVYYFLTIGSILSFFIFSFIERNPTP